MKIDFGQVCDLDMRTVEEAPYPDIFIGQRRRNDPGPPTTRALAEAVAKWREQPESKPLEP